MDSLLYFLIVSGRRSRPERLLGTLLIMWSAQNSTQGWTLSRQTGIFLKLSYLSSIRTPMLNSS